MRPTGEVLVPFIALATAFGIAPAQLGLAWLLSRVPSLLVIPGTTQESHLRENISAASISLDDAALQPLDAVVEEIRPVGNRYSDATQADRHRKLI